MSAEAALSGWQWIVVGLFPTSSIVSQVVGYIRGSRAHDEVVKAKDAQIALLTSALEDEKRHSAREVLADVLAFKELYLEAKEKYGKAKNELERARTENETLAKKVTDLQRKISEMKSAGSGGDKASRALDEVLDLASAVRYSGTTVVNSVTSVMDSTTAGESIIASAWEKLSPEEWNHRAARLRAGGSWEEPDQPANPRK